MPKANFLQQSYWPKQREDTIATSAHYLPRSDALASIITTLIHGDLIANLQARRHLNSLVDAEAVGPNLH